MDRRPQTAGCACRQATNIAFCRKNGVTATSRQAWGSQEGLGLVPVRPKVPCVLTALRCAPCALLPAGCSWGMAGAGVRPVPAGPSVAEGAQPGVSGAMGPQKCWKPLWRTVPVLWYHLTPQNCNGSVGGGQQWPRGVLFPLSRKVKAVCPRCWPQPCLPWHPCNSFVFGGTDTCLVLPTESHSPDCRVAKCSVQNCP